MALFASVIEALGNEIQQSGEEVVALGEENIRFERSAYPVVYNPTLRQKLVIDPEGKIPASLKSRLNDPRIGAQVLPMPTVCRFKTPSASCSPDWAISHCLRTGRS